MQISEGPDVEQFKLTPLIVMKNINRIFIFLKKFWAMPSTFYFKISLGPYLQYKML